MSGSTTFQDTDPTNTATYLDPTTFAGYQAAQDEIAQMNDAFKLATAVNADITVAKTVDGSEETAAQQRPNIG